LSVIVLLRMENTVSASITLPLSIALYQIKDNDTGIIVLAYFFQKM